MTVQPPPKTKAIFKVTLYVDEQGRQVTTFAPIDERQKEQRHFKGRATMMMQQQALPIEFDFPAGIKTLQEAFDAFDLLAQSRADEVIALMMKQQQERSKQPLIMPARPGMKLPPMPGTLK